MSPTLNAQDGGNLPGNDCVIFRFAGRAVDEGGRPRSVRDRMETMR